MVDLLNLAERACALRQRIAEFLERFGELTPEMRLLDGEAERIENCLKALSEELSKPTT